MVAKIKNRIKSLFVKKVERPNYVLTWTVADFEAAKAWCKSQPHPHNPKQTLWDYVYGTGRIESAEILEIVNQLLKKLNTDSTKEMD